MRSASPQVVAYVVTVDLAALALVLGTVRLTGISRIDLVQLAVLGVGCLLHLELTRGIERLREVAVYGSPCTNLTCMWIFAALIVLPPAFVVSLIVLACLHGWVRGPTRPVPFRKAFGTASTVLASGCAGSVLAVAGFDGSHGFPDGPLGLLVVLAAMVTWWLVLHALALGATVLADPDATIRAAVGNPSEQLVAGAALGLGVAIAALLKSDPWLVPVVTLTVLAVHRGLLLHQYELAARTDSKTGLLNARSWHQIAAQELARCHRMGGTLGLLMVDLDHFKLVNDRYGHLAGDQVLHAVAAAIRREVRRDDVVGRFGGEEFVVALPDVTADQLAGAADRLCRRIRALTVDVDDGRGPVTAGGLTCSIGAAHGREPGATLDELLLAADNALFLAKKSGRDQVRAV